MTRVHSRRIALNLLNAFLLLNTCILCLPAVSQAKSAGKPPVRTIPWLWSKNFQQVVVHDLAMAWNGSLLAFAATETGAGARPGDVVVIVNQGSHVLKDWRVSKKITGLALDGSGKKLLAELEDGSLLWYRDWESGAAPVALKAALRGAMLSPKGTSVVIRDAAGLTALSPEAKELWSYRGKPGTAWKALFPLPEKENRLLLAADNGEIVLIEAGKELWKADVKGKPSHLASSLLAGGMLAVATNGGNGTVRFFRDTGALSGKADLPPSTVSLDCSTVGTICAALGNGENGQILKVYEPTGKEIWTFRMKDKARRDARAAVAAQGGIVIAGIEEQGAWSIRAWEGTGKPLWTGKIESELVDFKVSWNGRKIAAITKDNHVVFFDVDAVTPGGNKAK